VLSIDTRLVSKLLKREVVAVAVLTDADKMRLCSRHVQAKCISFGAPPKNPPLTKDMNIPGSAVSMALQASERLSECAAGDTGWIG